jgi:hypothetical protein
VLLQRETEDGMMSGTRQLVRFSVSFLDSKPVRWSLRW